MKNESDYFCHLVFLIQNENHALNAISALRSDSKYTFIILDKYTGLEVEKKIPKDAGHSLIILSNPGEKLFYNVGYLGRILMVLRVRNIYRAILSDIGKNSDRVKIIIGNDSALAKALILVARKIFTSLQVEMWIDTLMGARKKNIRDTFFVRIEKWSILLGIGDLVPTVFGTSRLVDRVFVSHGSNKEALVKRGQMPSKIEVRPSPRFKAMKIRANQISSYRTGRVLIVASAWEWHGRSDIEDWQSKFFNNLAHKMNQDRKVKQGVSIRLHPRQLQTKLATELSHYLSKIDSYEQDLIESDCIISFRSSALFDAYQLGKEVYVYEVEAPEVQTNAFLESLPRVSDLDSILKLNQE